eukprot:6560995-Pyramimonas_sp.AAC.1
MLASSTLHRHRARPDSPGRIHGRRLECGAVRQYLLWLRHGQVRRGQSHWPFSPSARVHLRD